MLLIHVMTIYQQSSQVLVIAEVLMAQHIARSRMRFLAVTAHSQCVGWGLQVGERFKCLSYTLEMPFKVCIEEL